MKWQYLQQRTEWNGSIKTKTIKHNNLMYSKFMKIPLNFPEENRVNSVNRNGKEQRQFSRTIESADLLMLHYLVVSLHEKCSANASRFGG